MTASVATDAQGGGHLGSALPPTDRVPRGTTELFHGADAWRKAPVHGARGADRPQPDTGQVIETSPVPRDVKEPHPTVNGGNADAIKKGGSCSRRSCDHDRCSGSGLLS